MNKLFSAMMFVVLVPFAVNTASAGPYPYTSCNHPGFGSCAAFQQYWNKVDLTRWANCPWHPMARACWNQQTVHWRCPVNRKLPHYKITAADIINLHDWTVRITRLAKDNGDWAESPKAESVAQYLNGLTTNYLNLGLAKRDEIGKAVRSLSEEDMKVIAEVVVKYSTKRKIEKWLKYIVERVPGCSNDPTTSIVVNKQERLIRDVIQAVSQIDQIVESIDAFGITEDELKEFSDTSSSAQ